MQTVCWAAASLPPATASLPPATQSVPAKAIGGRVKPQFGGLPNHHCSQVKLGVSVWSPSKKLMEGGTEANLGCRISSVLESSELWGKFVYYVLKPSESLANIWSLSGGILALILTNTLQPVMLWHPKHESLGIKWIRGKHLKPAKKVPFVRVVLPAQELPSYFRFKS